MILAVFNTFTHLCSFWSWWIWWHFQKFFSERSWLPKSSEARVYHFWTFLKFIECSLVFFTTFLCLPLHMTLHKFQIFCFYHLKLSQSKLLLIYVLLMNKYEEMTKHNLMNKEEFPRNPTFSSKVNILDRSDL
jgi:hypothetical protein